MTTTADLLEQIEYLETNWEIDRKLLQDKIKEIAEYKTVLEWYADDSHWTLSYIEGPHGDYGIRAKDILLKWSK